MAWITGSWKLRKSACPKSARRRPRSASLPGAAAVLDGPVSPCAAQSAAASGRSTGGSAAAPASRCAVSVTHQRRSTASASDCVAVHSAAQWPRWPHLKHTCTPASPLHTPRSCTHRGGHGKRAPWVAKAACAGAHHARLARAVRAKARHGQALLRHLARRPLAVLGIAARAPRFALVTERALALLVRHAHEVRVAALARAALGRRRRGLVLGLLARGRRVVSLLRTAPRCARGRLRVVSLGECGVGRRLLFVARGSGLGGGVCALGAARRRFWHVVHRRQRRRARAARSWRAQGRADAAVLKGLEGCCLCRWGVLQAPPSCA